MSIVPGVGGPVPDPHPRASRPGQRAFYASIREWARYGTDREWRVQVVDLPAAGPLREAFRKRTHHAWSLEMKRQGYTTGRGGEFGCQLIPDGYGGGWWTWGPNVGRGPGPREVKDDE
jgi:hypothetical protein